MPEMTSSDIDKIKREAFERGKKEGEEAQTIYQLGKDIQEIKEIISKRFIPIESWVYARMGIEKAMVIPLVVTLIIGVAGFVWLVIAGKVTLTFH